MDYSQDILRGLQPQHPFFIGLDSDGCVFDTMEIKQKECFCPINIKVWGLQPVAKYAREAVEFVNLYSKWRGSNRFPALLKVLDVLAERDEVKERGFKVPQLKSLQEWVESGAPLGNQSLEEEVSKTGDPILAKTLEWSYAINRAIEELVSGIPPFPCVRESLIKISGNADLICVSQTPAEALEREWAEHDLTQYVRLIAGQEFGTKIEHLELTTTGKYSDGHVLLVGDALGDLQRDVAEGPELFDLLSRDVAAAAERGHGAVPQIASVAPQDIT
jgi:phosphoglycolate phosphatase-like HAD superfamily hydrolase